MDTNLWSRQWPFLFHRYDRPTGIKFILPASQGLLVSTSSGIIVLELSNGRDLQTCWDVGLFVIKPYSTAALPLRLSS